MGSNSFRQAKAAVAGMVLAFTAGLAGLTVSPVHAQSASVTNTATIAPPDGANDTNPGNNTGSATVTINAAVEYSFCTAPNGSATSNAVYGIVNGVQIARYEPGAGSDANVPELALPTLGGDVNALMVDPARDRLLFHAGSSSELWAYDADNGGWYVAATGVTGNFPRGGMTAAGIGYLMEGGPSPAVRRIDPSGTYGYTVTNFGNVTYDIPPTGSNTSGDIAFDSSGNAWLLVGRDLYRVDMTTLAATRQTRPLIDGNVPTIDFAGIAFADDGSLYLANNAGGSGSAYYRYDFATGNLTQTSTTAAGGSRDLGSCAIPTLATPDLSAAKTLAQVNGQPYVAGAAVAPGDVLTYAITVSNAGAAVGTLYPGDVIESVPANTAYVAAGNTFDQAAGADWTVSSPVNVLPGGNVVLNFVVQVDDPLPAGVTGVANNITFPPGDLIDCAAASNDCSETTPIGPSIVTTKTSDPVSGSNVTPGQTITYTLNVTVSNAATTAPLTLTDTLGAGLTFGAVTNAGAFTCNAANPLVCTLPSGTTPGSYAVTYTAAVDAGAAAGTTVANSVATDPTSNGGDPTPSCPAATPCTTEHNVIAGPNLVVGKTGPATAIVGVAYDYQIVVTNDGGAATTADATVTDTVPAGLTINTAAGCAIAGQVVTCTVPTGLSNVAPNNTASFTINVTPQASTSGTTVTNTASVNGGGDPDCAAIGDCPSPPVNTVVGAPNLEVGKTGPANATVGVAYDYVVTVSNTGTAATTAEATVTDVVPAGLTINTATGCTIAGQTVTCPVPAGLATGASASFTINVTPQTSTSGTTVTNTASVNGGGDPDCTAVGDCPSPPVNTVIGAPNLEIAKTGPANATVGVAYDYAITVSNTGASATAAATVTDAVPAGLTINSVTPAASCAVAGQNVTCTIPQADLEAGESVAITINVTPQASTSGTTVVNTASVGGGGDPDCAAVGSCPSPPVNTVVGAPNLEVGKTGPANATVGVAYDYAITVTNTGASATGDATVTDAVPAGLTINSVAPGFCTAAGQNVTCTIPQADLEAGESVAITISVTPQASTAGTTVTNIANVGGGGDPDCTTVGSCPSPPVETTIDAPNLSITKTGPANATVGVAYDYAITVTNTGASATADAVVTDAVPAGLTINSAGPGCTFAGQNVTCTIPQADLEAGESVAITINVTPQASTSGTTVTNTANVNGGGDPDCAAIGDCPSPPVNTVVGAPNLEVAKTGPANATVGAAYDYVITVTNTGTAATTAEATVTDVVPAGLTINTATGCTIAGQTVTCPVPAGLATGATASFTINVTPQASTSGTTVTNTASVSGGGDPDCTAVGDCPSPPVNTVVGAPNLEIGKTGPANATVGVAYDYTITVTNTGTAATTADAMVTDAVPAGLTINTATGCTIAGQTVTCPVPAGLATGATASFTINVTPQASTSGTTVTNTANVNGGGDPDCAAIGDCPSPPVNTVVGAPNLEVAKTGPANATVGAAYDYVITVTNTGTAATTAEATVTDVVPAGLTINTATGCTIAGQTVTCPVPAGLAAGATASFTINVTPQASTSGTTVTNTASVSGGGDPDCTAVGDCPSPPVNTQVAEPVVTYGKSSNPASGTDVEVGSVITYTLRVTVAAAPTLSDVVLTDTVGTGLGNMTVTNPGAFAGGFAGNTGTFTLAAGAAPGTYEVIYTATVQASAGATVGNSVEASGGGNPPGPGEPPSQPTCDPTCTTEHNVVKPAVTVVKSADPAPGTDVAAGDTITYTLTATVANASLLSDVVLTDTLGTGLSFGAVTNAGAFACTGSLVCTLTTGTAPGTYAVTYTATVDASAATTVSNSVVPTGGNLPPGPGQPPTDPTCTTCSVEHNVTAPVITVVKSSNPGSGSEVRAGDTITYTLTATVANSATRDILTLTDTLGAGLSFGAVTNAGAFTCTGALTCSLPTGTPAGTYAVSYSATVDANATGTVRNAVVATGGTGDGGTPPECGACSTEHPLADPRVVIGKSATPGEDREVAVGDVIQYTLTATIENSATRSDVRLVDTPSAGLAVGALPAGCATEGATVVCTLPAGSVPGVYTFVYPATVTAAASGSVENRVVGESVGGGQPPPECTDCDTRHEVSDDAQLRIVKAVGVRNVKVGDLVRYTLTVENVGAVNVTGANVIDTPPAGFSYVEGSMAVADRDGAFTLEGKHPLRIGGLDIDAGEQATIVYLLRVGAGVRPGVLVNEAVAVNGSGNPISNVATAQVTLDTDPLLDDSLIFGTVFDDRDGDGWQDRADLGDVRVQGGFAPGAYIAGSTTIDRGNGPQPLADASAPLLHGIDVGAIAARQSEGDPVDARRVTIRQRLRSADITNDFVLTSAQGVTVRMDADGNTMVERSGEAEKGLTAAEPTVERVVSAVDGGVEVAYVISNRGIDERGIPGVRIASVEGLLIETDQYGRYHLADVQGGDWGHGRNFLLKVDPATLPPGTVFTTENPRVRRVTPGIPVRFDFGVKLPVQVLEGGERKADLELGEVIFTPGSAEVREAYLPAIEQMASKVDEYRGGEVVIVADGDSEGLAFARAAAVRDALQARVGAEAKAGLSVVLRTRVDDPHSLVAGVDASGTLLGTVLFDTDKSNIRPEFDGLLDAVAQRLEALGGGVVGIVGHTDVRGSHAYNTALGLRRATAVQQALAQRLSQEVRAKVRVETSSDPTVPVGTERK